MNRRLARTFFALLALGMIATAVRSQPISAGSTRPKPATPASDESKIAQAKLIEDFRLARHALEESHSGIYRYTPKEELDRRFDAAEKTLDRPMTAVEFYRVLAPVVAAIKCGHTGIRPPQGNENERKILPLNVRVLEGKVYVFRDLSAEKGGLAGLEIRSINGIAATEIVKTMIAAVWADGDIQTARQRRISGQNFAISLVDLLGLKSPYEVSCWDASKEQEKKVKLEGIEVAKLQEAARTAYPQDQRPKEAARLAYFDDGKIAQMKINGFGGFVDAEHKKDLKAFYTDSFEEFETRHTQVLILDLRDNGGGADELGKLLLSYLIDEPFKYYDDLVINALDYSFRKYTGEKQPLPADVLERQPNGKYRAVKHPNWGTQQPSKPTFRGKVYILINGNSFSTTSEFLSHVHFRKRATFIGEESAGGYYGNSSGFMPRLTLPNTKVMVGVPMMTYYMAVSGYKDASRGVVPDHEVKYTIAELIAGTDKELALALELSRKQ